MPISVKSLVAPVCLVGLMAAMVVVSSRSAQEQGRAMAYASDTLPARTAEVARAIDTVTQAHVELFRAVTWAANSDDAKKVAEYSLRVAASLARLDTFLSGVRQRWDLADDAAGLVEAGRSALSAYGLATRRVLLMATTDPTTSFIMMFQADKHFDNLRTRLEVLRDGENRRSVTAVAEALRAERRSRFGLYGLLGVALLVAGAVAVMATRLIGRPVIRMTEAMSALAAGATAVAVPGLDRQDEIGRMARAVQVFKEGIVESGHLASERDAERDLKARRGASIERLSRDFDAAVAAVSASLSEAAGEMQQTAGSMSAAATLGVERSEAVAAAAGNADLLAQRIASAADRLSSSIAGVGQQVATSAAVTRLGAEEARRADEVGQHLVRSAGCIGDVARLIRSVAAQTNLLALNATIEAARAGDAGRGFAVVASEVKFLANQTARATEEIGVQIDAIQGATQEAVEAIARINGVIVSVANTAGEISRAVEEQAQATTEIASAVRQMVDGTQDVSRNGAGLRSTAAETGLAARRVLDAAASVAQRSEQITTQLQQYLCDVKAA